MNDDKGKAPAPLAAAAPAPEAMRRPYTAPEIRSEPLIAFGALCNGTSIGGRKASTGAPNFCNAAKLKS
jgi:hypothetical protein